VVEFFSRDIPEFERVLLIESGSRYLFDAFLAPLYQQHPEMTRCDLVTCFPGTPQGFDVSRGSVYRTQEYAGSEGRARLYQILKANRYSVGGLISSGEPYLFKWKWALFAHVPAKYFVLNENGDYFWLDYSNWRIIRHFLLFRAGLSGGEAVGTLARMALFPFTLIYLLLFAAYYHLRRKARV
jgi:hypothetical protein